MPYLIDGHNLIPKMGLKLADPQDEMQLIDLLQEFCRIKQTQVEIYFDGANPGQPTKHKIGRVIAYFVRKGTIADAAIEKRLQKLGREARNWSVVSSDLRVQASAREVHARVIASDDFARSVLKPANATIGQDKTETSLSPQDVDEWMEFFKNSKKDPNKF